MVRLPALMPTLGPVALVAAALALSACGSSSGDRGLSGAGGLTGLLTDEDTLGLGTPWWK